MMRAARALYALGLLGMAAMILRAGDLGAIFQPVPDWIPAPRALAWLSGGVLLPGALALLAGAFAAQDGRAPRFAKAERLAAAAIALDFGLLWFALLNLPNTLATPKETNGWEGCGLDLVALAGAWIAAARAAPPAAFNQLDGIGKIGKDGPAGLLGERGVRLARRAFALGIALVGINHFGHAQDATVYVPACFPAPIAWVYLTGAAHLAAALAIFTGVLAPLAATLEAAQISGFVLLAHLPAVARAPADEGQRGQLIYAVALAGAAWIVAATLRGPAKPR